MREIMFALVVILFAGIILGLISWGIAALLGIALWKGFVLYLIIWLVGRRN